MSESTEAIAVREETGLIAPRDIVAVATDQARVLADVIEKNGLFSMIQGRKYVKVEGWLTVARMNNVIPREVEVTKEDGVYTAVVELVRLSDGMALTRASAECGGDEGMWANRPAYARRSMAITRATGKACRIAYSWIVALAGYEPTPAEEMQEEGHAPAAAAPARPKATVVPTPQGSLETTSCFIVDVTEKEGQKDGRPYTLYTVVDDADRKYTTFSDDLSDLASDYKKRKEPVFLQYEENKFGKKLTGIVPSTLGG